jgi:DNA-binding NarL/FixJ family response regulator
MTRSRLLLADDHVLLVQALRTLLEPDFDVVGMVGDGHSLIEETARLHPDIVVLDIAMPLLNGIDAGRQLRAKWPSTKLIYLTMNLDPAVAAEALRLGASGYVLKSSDAAELKQAVREAVQGHSYIAPRIAQQVVEALAAHREGAVQLSTRQREVLQLLAEGRSMKEAADILDVAPRTIAFHKYRMMELLQVKTNAELIQFAVKQGLVA